MPADPETKQELTDAEHIRLMTEGKGWQLIHAALQGKILDLQNMANLDRSKPLEAQIDGRMFGAQIFFDWLKNEVYGRIEGAQNASSALENKEEETYVDRG